MRVDDVAETVHCLFGTFDRLDILCSPEVCRVDLTASNRFTEGGSFLVDSMMQ